MEVSSNLQNQLKGACGSVSKSWFLLNVAFRLTYNVIPAHTDVGLN
uniref:Uncharacterized protein n=1 Tax=Rhizophora mucronata TaxID=61149 RepID=A0A2P2QMM8_RHIMU